MKRVILLTRERRSRLGAADRTSRHPLRSPMIVPRLIILAIAAALASIALIGLASGKPALAVSSLVNGNFETGDLTGWTVDTTKSGGDARAVTSYCPFEDAGFGVTCDVQSGVVTPQEGSYFALLQPGGVPPDAIISQSFNASNGDRVSGWAFFTAEDWSYSYSEPCDLTGYASGQVVVRSDSGTTVATPFVHGYNTYYNSEGWDGGYHYGSWVYWEHTFSDVTGEGSFQIEAQVLNANCISGILGVDDVKTTTLDPDTTKPSTSATRSVEPNAEGWNKEDVTVKLNATDNEGGWGLKEITYRINGGEPTTKQGDSVEVPAIATEGENTIAYYATDKAGNVEDEQSLQVKIDKTPPKLDSTSPASGATRVSTTDPKISATFLESGSGIDPNTLLNSNTFRVYQVISSGRSQNYVQVSGTTRCDDPCRTVTFTPEKPLAKGTYEATITPGVEDKAGNRAYSAYWKFSTTAKL